MAGFEDGGRETQDKECRQPLADRKVEEMESP